MSGVIQKFLLASVAMWMAPIGILLCFNHKIFPGSSLLSSSSVTLLSGFLAVISVNLVIVMYIIMAMREPPTSQPQPDAAFLADAKASIKKPITSDGSPQHRDKED
ncbi:uncharacterized protein LOC144704835 [Wolffia australiana]